MLDRDYGYAAGLLDGEGSVYIAKHGGVRTNHTLALVIYNTNLDALKWLRERWGGSISGHLSARKWSLTGDKARRFLGSIFSNLIIKYHHARLGIVFQLAMNNPPRHRNVKVTPRETYFREAIKEQMQFWTKWEGVYDGLAR